MEFGTPEARGEPRSTTGLGERRATQPAPRQAHATAIGIMMLLPTHHLNAAKRRARPKSIYGALELRWCNPFCRPDLGHVRAAPLTERNPGG